MGLDKEQLFKSILEAFDNESDKGVKEKNNKMAEARKNIANAIADAIHNYITQADVEVHAGIMVATTGTAAAQTGKTTSTGSGKIK